MESNDILYFRGRLYIPKPIILTILESEHNSKVAGHFGQEKMIKLVRQIFW